RQGRDVLVARDRGGADHRRDLRRLGLAELRAGSARVADQRGNTRAAADHAELPARNSELRPADRKRQRGGRRDHDAAVDGIAERPDGAAGTLFAAVPPGRYLTGLRSRLLGGERPDSGAGVGFVTVRSIWLIEARGGGHVVRNHSAGDGGGGGRRSGGYR